MIVIGGPYDGQDVVRPGSSFMTTVARPPVIPPRRLSRTPRDLANERAASSMRDFRIYRYRRKRLQAGTEMYEVWMPQDGRDLFQALAQFKGVWAVLVVMSRCW